MEAGGGGGGSRGGVAGAGGGADVLNSENNGRIRWQPSQIGRLNSVSPTEGLEEYVCELYSVSNQSSHTPSTRTVGKCSCKVSKPWKVRHGREL